MAQREHFLKEGIETHFDEFRQGVVSVYRWLQDSIKRNFKGE
jgi:hypothetical protein